MTKTQQSPQNAERPAWQRIAGPKQSKREPGLYIVSTPIGNLGDITLRALDVLADCDALYCEDTRVTQKLLNAFAISRPAESYHDHNAARMRPRILERLARGEMVALVSDAGTPLLSDPGYKLVRAAIDAGHNVESVPGASAPLAALVVAGLPTDRFGFFGFLPVKPGARRKALEQAAGFPGTLVFFETGPRLARSLADMAAAFGARPAAVARELTKAFEEVQRGPLTELAAKAAGVPPPKGELVVLVGPDAGAALPDADALDAALAEALGSMSTRDAVDAVAAQTGHSRKTVYQAALALKSKGR